VTGILCHFGELPEEPVMRVYAAALTDEIKVRRMTAYFFKSVGPTI
jgi:hypothetical protein